MKILVIVHVFPPKQSAGTEVYTYKLAKALQERGHDLCIYYTERDPDCPQYELRRGAYDGLPYFAVVHNHDFEHFRGTYKDERMEEHLRMVLDEIRPDVVHVQHLHLHSIDYIGIIKERGIPIVYTLAEYLNICLRNGFLAKLDFKLCDGPETNACAVCAPGVWPAPKDDEVPSVAELRFSLRRFLEKVPRKLGRVPRSSDQSIVVADERYVQAVDRRWREHKAQLDQVDLFLAPSRFLRDQFIRTRMIAADRIVYSDYGFDHEPFSGPRPYIGRSDKLRVGFIGMIAEQKGVHLLVEAFNGITEEGVECLIYGGLETFPDYVAQMRVHGTHTGVRFMGRYENNKVAEVLGGIDVLVVPSIWFENSPLTIHEAFMAGVPVITGDNGGMAELVEHEKSGLHFRMGDSADLRRQIVRLLHEPELLERMREQIPIIKDIAEDASEMEARFQKLVGRVRPNAGGK